MNDLGYRIIAVLLAIALWGFVGMGSRFEMGQRKFTIPIELKGTPATLELKPLPASAELVLEGPVRALDRLRPEDFAAFVDLADHWEDDRTPFELDVHSPPGVKLTKIEPTRIRVIPKDLRNENSDHVEPDQARP